MTKPLLEKKIRLLKDEYTDIGNSEVVRNKAYSEYKKLLKEWEKLTGYGWKD